MQKCLRCNNLNLIIDSEHKFHNIYKCLICNYLTPFRIDECCKNSYLYVAIDNENSQRLRLHRQCLYCGGCVDRSRPLSFKLFGSEIRYDFNHNKYHKWIEERNIENTILWENVKESNYDTSKYAKYTNYIHSESWKMKRNEALNRDKNLCQVCGNKAEEVHHKTYENLFNEKLEELLSVCQKCHKEIHVKIDKERLDELRNRIKKNKGIG